MYYELQIKSPTGIFNVFLQNGFFDLLANKGTVFHKHNYAEVHLILGGSVLFNIENEIYEAKSGDILVIPPRHLHSYKAQDVTVKHTAFQIELNVDSVNIYQCDEDILNVFFKEIKRTQENNDYTRLSAFLSLLTCYFSENENIKARPVTNYGFLIREFFSINYGQSVVLSDLANQLHLSERHAERLVIEYMGKTFKEALVESRMMIAQQLIESSDLSLREIAQYVGYHSYAGFWKAMKKYGQQQKLK